MDIDISDILADVSRSVRLQHSQSLGTTDLESSYADHQQLVKSWTSERCSPELLPYPTELMKRIMRRIGSQIAKIEDMTSGIYDSGSAQKSSNNQNLNLILSILQTDLSRTQFIVRSLLRQRLSKITKHAMFYLTQINSDTKVSLLSDAEANFLRNHQALLNNFYDTSFLSALPTALRKLDDSSGGMNMVEGPEQENAVIVRCLRESWSNSDLFDHSDSVSIELRMSRGEVWVVRWADVKAGVLIGDLELL